MAGPVMRASVATIQESLRRLNCWDAVKEVFGISRHDSGELEAVRTAAGELRRCEHQSPRFRRA